MGRETLIDYGTKHSDKPSTRALNSRQWRVVAGVEVSTGIRLVIAVLLTSIMMGLLHTEYGLVGVVASAVDSVFYSVLRYRYKTLWAPILAHGFIDAIGFVNFFFVGPIYGLW